eukprot:11162709-Lingulodinium_polyedra.AAC.1
MKNGPKDLEPVDELMAFGWLLKPEMLKECHQWKTTLLSSAGGSAKRKAMAHGTASSSNAKFSKVQKAKETDLDLADLFGG